jgi:hypothetical protein
MPATSSTRIVYPRVLDSMVSYDVASNICQARCHRTCRALVRSISWHPMTRSWPHLPYARPQP